ncbi:MAG: helix-turn-helix domain-containing protein [Dokdonella sp.]|nr:MAG: helix-turn-helix domain-containing protein [Dokdonella sp.]
MTIVQPTHDDAAVTEFRMPATGQSSLGERLRAAREARAWGAADVAGQLRLPQHLVERLERDDYAGINDAVFLRGYLRSYAALVGVPVEDALRVADANSQVAPLVATGTISRSRYLFERYSASATYLTLTALIVVPAVWLATHGGLRQDFTRITPLDPPAPLAAPATSGAFVADSTHGHGHLGSAPATAASDEAGSAAVTALQEPIVASMTPFQLIEAPRLPEAPAVAPATASAGAHVLVLRLAEPSWVEVSAADGRKLEYAMLPAGSVHEYRSDGVLNLSLGNSGGVQVHADGNEIDLAQFRRGNVAHLKLFGSAAALAERAQP